MREPDRTKIEKRSAEAVWVLGPEVDGKTQLATLNVIHSTSSKAFYATLRRETEEKWEHGTVSSFELFGGLRIRAERVARYSDKRLKEFFDAALADLAELADEGARGVLSIFEGEGAHA